MDIDCVLKWMAAISPIAIAIGGWLLFNKQKKFEGVIQSELHKYSTQFSVLYKEQFEVIRTLYSGCCELEEAIIKFMLAEPTIEAKQNAYKELSDVYTPIKNNFNKNEVFFDENFIQEFSKINELIIKCEKLSALNIEMIEGRKTEKGASLNASYKELLKEIEKMHKEEIVNFKDSIRIYFKTIVLPKIQ